MNNQDCNTIATEASTFRDNFKTLHLATIDTHGKPVASYAPYVLLDDGGFGVLISRLARHTQNLLHNPAAAVLFIEPESTAGNLFARRRLSFQCLATHTPRNQPEYAQLTEALIKKFGAIARQITQLPDFEAFHLKPVSAEFVKGFGSAWRFSDGRLADNSLIRPDQ